MATDRPGPRDRVRPGRQAAGRSRSFHPPCLATSARTAGARVRRSGVRLAASLTLLLVVCAASCEMSPDNPCNPKRPEAWCLERPTAWYLLVVHDYAVYKGVKGRISDDAERTVLGVFDTETQLLRPLHESRLQGGR